jgi:uncharacterized membrane protein YebE (DUF533 family)
MARLECSCPLTKQIESGTSQLNRSNTMKSNLMKKTLGILVLGSLGLMATGAQADWNRDSHAQGGHATQQGNLFGQQVNARQQQQVERIQDGMRAGSLTRFEFNNLMHEQGEIRALEQRFRADGFIDAREFQRLDRALDVANQNIRAEKHDHQARYAYNPNPWFN